MSLNGEESQLDSLSALANRIGRDEPGSIQDFYDKFSRGIRFLFLRSLGPQDLEDHVHNCLIACINALKNGHGMREPEKLAGFVQTITRRHIGKEIERRVAERNTRVDLVFEPLSHTPGADQAMIRSEAMEAARNTLAGLSARDREVLRRFYLEEQHNEQICREMSITPTQFRNIKHRAKKRCSDRCQKLLRTS